MPLSLRGMDETTPAPDFSITNAPYGLQGKLLVATPHIGDPLFEKSVIYMCLHGEDGAMGVVVNHIHHGLTDRYAFLNFIPHSTRESVVLQYQQVRTEN